MLATIHCQLSSRFTFINVNIETQNYNLTLVCMGVKLAPSPQGKAQAKGVWERGAKWDTWTHEADKQKDDESYKTRSFHLGQQTGYPE
jgi:hypothetical protein